MLRMAQGVNMVTQIGCLQHLDGRNWGEPGNRERRRYLMKWRERIKLESKVVGLIWFAVTMVYEGERFFSSRGEGVEFDQLHFPSPFPVLVGTWESPLSSLGVWGTGWLEMDAACKKMAGVYAFPLTWPARATAGGCSPSLGTHGPDSPKSRLLHLGPSTPRQFADGNVTADDPSHSPPFLASSHLIRIEVESRTFGSLGVRQR